MDNRHVDVTSVGKEDLRAALSALMKNTPSNKVTHYLDLEATKDRPRTLVLLWHEENGAVPLPSLLDLEGAVDLAWRWLSQLPNDDRFGSIDMDGDCRPEAFRCFCEDWGHVAGLHYAVAGIQGCYAWYGK